MSVIESLVPAVEVYSIDKNPSLTYAVCPGRKSSAVKSALKFCDAPVSL